MFLVKIELREIQKSFNSVLGACLKGDVHVLQLQEPGEPVVPVCFCQAIACWHNCWIGLRAPSRHARVRASSLE